MQPTKTKFFFKSRKEKDAEGNVVKVKNEKNEVIDKVIPAAPAVDLEIPLMTVEDVANVMNGGEEKQIKLVLEAVNNIILEQARDLVNNDVTAAREKGIDSTLISWEYIANLPPATRKGSAIPDEVWEAFEKDYVAVMVHHGKTEDKAKMGAKLLAKRFQPVKSNKKVIEALKGNLQVWFTNTSVAEEFQDVYETLMSKADTLMAADEEAILAAV